MILRVQDGLVILNAQLLTSLLKKKRVRYRMPSSNREIETAKLAS
jgi:hypothetical protein